MNKDFKEYTIYNSVTPVAVTSSTDATPIVVTATSHGFSTGDFVLIQGHTTNIAANGIFKVTRVDANSFSLQDRYTGANIAGSAGGAGASGLCCVAPKIIYCGDFKHAVISYITAGTSTHTVKIAGSLGKISADANTHGDTPNFGATVSDTNPYSFVQFINLDTAAAVNGATGFAASGTDLNITAEVNTNALKYLTLIPTAWTQGSFTAKVFLTNNN